MTEQELRALVRDAIARQAGSAPSGTLAPLHPRTLAPSHHVSHTLLVVPGTDGPCIIEPAVTCNHCGYCKSYGH